MSFADDDDTAKESDDSFAPSSVGRSRKKSSSVTKPLSDRNVASNLSPLAESDTEVPAKTPATGKKKLFNPDQGDPVVSSDSAFLNLPSEQAF